MTYKLGLIGYPLGHSISKVIHNAGFESLGVDAQYELLDTPAENLIERIKLLKNEGYDGFNITIPLKVPMKLFIDSADEYADITGCVNTVKISSDKEFIAYNTDVYGFKNAIPQEVKQTLKNSCTSILGTGGAARAAVVGLCELGVQQINLYSRNIINASDSVNYFRRIFPNVQFNLYQNSSKGHLFESAMIVNTTPIGMKGHSADEMPLSPSIIEELPKSTVIYDVIYNPSKTLLIQCSQSFGLRTINGLDMLLYQAAKAQEIWLGKAPNIDKMKIAALEALL